MRRSARTCFCILAYGEPYLAVARESAASVLRHSQADVLLAHQAGRPPGVAAGERVRLAPLEGLEASGERAAPFLLKFHALARCLAAGDHEHVVLMDADAVLVRRLAPGAIAAALGEGELGMVEQRTITGSTMGRAEFLDHYVRHALACLDPGAAAPDIERFRYYNSGVVIGRRSHWRALVAWALETARERAGRHRIGEHMVADQDYFQYWAMTRPPGACVTLPWSWNHCEHWDAGFPRRGARILHFSNFCSGPDAATPARMRALSGAVDAASPAAPGSR